MEENYKQALQESRLADKPDQEAPASPRKESGEQSAVDVSSDISYFLAIGFAALKDLLDFVGIGSLPVLGTIVTLMFGGIIAILIIKANPKKITRNMLLLFGGTATEALLPGLNLLPVMTGTVVGIYVKIMAERKGIDIPSPTK
jgi:F0F1-type ATP synthase assembly protein I